MRQQRSGQGQKQGRNTETQVEAQAQVLTLTWQDAACVPVLCVLPKLSRHAASRAPQLQLHLQQLALPWPCKGCQEGKEAISM